VLQTIVMVLEPQLRTAPMPSSPDSSLPFRRDGRVRSGTVDLPMAAEGRSSSNHNLNAPRHPYRGQHVDSLDAGPHIVTPQRSYLNRTTPNVSHRSAPNTKLLPPPKVSPLKRGSERGLVCSGMAISVAE
jgi:hypothetical protein